MRGTRGWTPFQRVACGVGRNRRVRVQGCGEDVSIHDLHATMLNQMGIDHTKLTYRYAGRDFRLTDVYGEVVRDILV
jgi:hypothetical protein